MTEHEMVGWHHRLDGPEFKNLKFLPLIVLKTE